MMTPVDFTSDRFNAECRRRQRVMGAPHAPPGTGLFVLLYGHLRCLLILLLFNFKIFQYCKRAFRTGLVFIHQIASVTNVPFMHGRDRHGQ